MFFDRVGRDLIGTPLISLLRHGRSPIAPLQEIVQSTRGDLATPRELTAVVSRKFRFVVSISNKCFTSDDDELSFQVLRIDAPLGQQPHSSVVYRASSLTTGSTSSSTLPSDVIMTPAAPLTPSSNLAGNSSNPSASVGVSPEGRTPVPVLSSPPVTKPAVIGLAHTPSVRKLLSRAQFNCNFAKTSSYLQHCFKQVPPPVFFLRPSPAPGQGQAPPSCAIRRRLGPAPPPPSRNCSAAAAKDLRPRDPLTPRSSTSVAGTCRHDPVELVLLELPRAPGSQSP